MDLKLTTLSLQDYPGGVLVVTLQRPQVCNAINFEMMQELVSLWHYVSNEAMLRVVILTGAGDKAFCAGADLKERSQLSTDRWREQHLALQEAMQLMVQCPVPVIAAVNGVAYGGGLELALACDFAFASEQAVFSQSEVKLGLMPGAMGTQNLPRAVGQRRAKQLTFTGETFDANQALSWGVINRVLPHEQLLNAVLNCAAQIAKNAPVAVRQAKKSINRAVASDILSGYQFEIECYNPLLDTQDRSEGIAAFNEKRQPEFKGE